jgi:hypothetical protein
VYPKDPWRYSITTSNLKFSLYFDIQKHPGS